MALDPIHRFNTSGASGAVGLRIGDAEREQAAAALGEHLRAGRLTVTEYDERLEQAFAARTAAQLTPLFADLPGGAPRSASTPGPDRSARRARRTMPVPMPLRAVVILAVIVGAVVWTAFTAFPPLFLIPLFFVIRRFGPGHRYGRYHDHGPSRYARRRYDYAGPQRY